MDVVNDLMTFLLSAEVDLVQTPRMIVPSSHPRLLSLPPSQQSPPLACGPLCCLQRLHQIPGLFAVDPTFMVPCSL